LRRVLEKAAGRAVTGRVAFLVSGLIDVGVLVVYLMRMRRQRRTRARAGLAVIVGVLAFGAVSILGGAAAPAARASTTEQSILMDDYAFIYSDPTEVAQNLEQIKALGVTTVKVSMVWSLLAPDPNSSTEPDFDATDPAAYPTGNWTRYDDLVQEADQLGLRVYFQLTGPAPLWATDDTGLVPGLQNNWSHDLNATDFGQFVQAVGARYSGIYPVAGDGDTDSLLAASGDTVIPAVSEWGIWNEPNESAWLSPQTARAGHKLVAVAPVIERRLIDDAYTSLLATGHANDTILIGETSSLGQTHTIPFLRDLFCLDAQYKPLTGTAANTESCPATGSRSTFVEENPGLFGASGYADHAYDFFQAPNQQVTGEPWAMNLANISVLGRALDQIDSAYGQPTGLPIYNTEWGYKTDPPNPEVLTNLTEQEDWLDQGYYMSYFMPRLKSMAQELLYDQPPFPGKAPGALGYWANFDTGIEFEDGAAKPSLAAYRLPIWVPDPTASNRLRVWAEIRPALAGGNTTAELEYQAPGTTAWTNVTRLTTSNVDGFVYTYVSLPSPGAIRLAWADPAASAIYYSRSVKITRP
jgi:hypothetical protein